MCFSFALSKSVYSRAILRQQPWNNRAIFNDNKKNGILAFGKLRSILDLCQHKAK